MAQVINQTKDTAGVIAPPPLIALAVVVIGLLLDWLLPAYLLMLMLSIGDRIVIGAILIAAGVALVFAARGAFVSAGTNVEPWKPSTALVTDGIFGRLRNPMYVGGLLALAGLSILLASDWMMVMTILSAPVLHYGVVKREERYLAAKFGEPYLRYMSSVPRYGIPL
jgi:protein-S-isoprenylcysteine O-methyltransferase Ste14